MKIYTSLTKENFWNKTMEEFPKATKLFCEWIDKYKASVNWNKLFNDHYQKVNIEKAPNGEISHIEYSAPKFHDLPYEMQQGIWIRFAKDTLNECFEQPEYSYEFDLEEDIKTVFKEIEPLIDDEA